MPLLAALRIVVDARRRRSRRPAVRGRRPRRGAAHVSRGGLDATDVRALARALRAREKERAAQAGETAASSRELLRRSVLDPALLDGVGGSHAAAAAPAGRRCWRGPTPCSTAAARPRRCSGCCGAAPTGDVGCARPPEHGGNAARFAHRDLDALCALFEAAAKAEEQRGHTSVQSFLDTLTAQEIPADTLADRGVRGEAVRLLTAHRSKGLEWRLVVVAHVQEGRGPTCAAAPPCSSADRIGRDGLLPPLITTCDAGRGAAAVLRRLHPGPRAPGRHRRGLARRRGRAAVAVRPRARARARCTRSGRPPRPLSLPGWWPSCAVPSPIPSSPARSGARPRPRLARLAATEVGRPPGRAPGRPRRRGGGCGAAAASDDPAAAARRAGRLSASALQGLLNCPAQWFLEQEAGGDRRQLDGAGLRHHRPRPRRPAGQGRLGADPTR